MSKTKIEWTDRVWNPVTGCTKVSQGCANCYAERMAKRLRGRCGYPQDEPFKVTLQYSRIKEPLTWKKPQRIFVCSMSDIFHPFIIPPVFIRDVWNIMEKCPQHTFIILTKRPINAVHFLKHGIIWELPNVWFGVSAENQQTADERIPILLQIPAAVKFVSCEPLLGPLNIEKYLPTADCLLPTLNWVITGGESGPRARPMHPDWVRSLRDQCQAAGVPFFFKQWGGWSPVSTVDGKQELPFGKYVLPDENSNGWGFIKVGKKAAGRLLDGREHLEMPGNINIKQ